MSNKKVKPSVSPFPHPWSNNFWGANVPKCLDEWLIIDLSNQIRQKPNWETKFTDPEIAAKWKTELQAQDHGSRNFDEVFNYTLKELDWYKRAEADLASSGFKYSINELILYSDIAISEQTKKDFKIYEELLEASIEKDYHPKSNNLVVDVVHPSLYHLVYDRTQEVVDGKLQTVKFSENIQKVKEYVLDYGLSKCFQWLPAIMTLDKNANRFEFASYINNLHPIKHSELYTQIATIFNACIPGLARCLSHFGAEIYTRIEIPNGSDAYNEEYTEKEKKLWELDLDPEQELEFEEELAKLRKTCIKNVLPSWEHDPIMKPINFASFDNLKVIVKLANIELTPENPKYEGGSWHVEGTINEDIVATILYYYDVENITESKLSFREFVNDPNYEQGDDFFCEYYYGLKDGDLMRKSTGSVTAQEDRVVIFPNIYQHHVDAFELADKTKPGHRKILCFFVVDPYNTNVKGSDTIPPQQEDWASDDALMSKYFPGIKNQKTMSYAEALENREKLMTERTLLDAAAVDDYEIGFYREFSLCEH